jgi:hypothetical protein
MLVKGFPEKYQYMIGPADLYPAFMGENIFEPEGEEEVMDPLDPHLAFIKIFFG